MADALSVEALSVLETALAALMPAGVPGGLSRQVRVHVRRIRPLGLGGYVGRHVAPDASLFGRRAQARVDVTIGGGNDNAASTYAATLAAAILTHSRSELAGHGFRRLERAPSEAPRVLLFDVDFEFVKLPSAGEELIEEIVLNTVPDG